MAAYVSSQKHPPGADPPQFPLQPKRHCSFTARSYSCLFAVPLSETHMRLISPSPGTYHLIVVLTAVVIKGAEAVAEAAAGGPAAVARALRGCELSKARQACEQQHSRLPPVHSASTGLFLLLLKRYFLIYITCSTYQQMDRGASRGI